MPSFIRSLPALALMVGINAPGLAAGDVVSLTATDQGFVTSGGGASKFDGLISPATFNYSVGFELICPDGGLCSSFEYGEKKNYFVFDLSTIATPVLEATLLLPMPDEGFTGPAGGSETFIIAGTGVPKPELDFLASPASPGDISPAHIGTAKAVFAGITDSFDGPPALPPFGSVDISDADEGGTVEVFLSSDAVDYINAAAGDDGTLILGGKLVTLDDSMPFVTQEGFSFTGGAMPDVELELITAVPLPAGGWLLLSALAGLGLKFRHRPRSGSQ